MLVVGVVVGLLLRGGKDGGGTEQTVADPLAESLSYVPASAQAVTSLDVQPDSEQGKAVRDLARTFPAARFAGDGLRSALRDYGLDPDQDVPKLLGGPLVLGGPSAALNALLGSLSGLKLDLGGVLRAGAVIAVTGKSASDVQDVAQRAVDDQRLNPINNDAPGGAKLYALPQHAGVVAVSGPEVVLAADTASVTRALALHENGGGMTRTAFEQRLGPLAGPALVRVAMLPRVIVGDRAKGVPFVDALRSGALALRVEEPGLRLRAHLATDASKLKPQDLPLATGQQAPRPAPGSAPMFAGIRDASQTLHVLDQAKDSLNVPFLAGVLDALRTLDEIKGPLKTFGRIDADAALIDQLTGTTTITKERSGWALRGELRDGGPLRTALDRIAKIPDVAIDLTGVTNLDLDNAGTEAYELRRGGTTFLRLAVLGNTLVVTSDLNAGLRAIANRKPQDVGAKGALAFRATGPAVQDYLVQRLGLPALARLVLGGFGDLDGWARSELDATDLEATLALNG